MYIYNRSKQWIPASVGNTIKLTPPVGNVPFEMVRKQFYLLLVFLHDNQQKPMTVRWVNCYIYPSSILQSWSFTALPRVRSFDGVKIFIGTEKHQQILEVVLYQ